MKKTRRFSSLWISLLFLAVSLPALAHPHSRFEWAISDGDKQTMISTSRSGHRAVERLEDKLDAPFVWIRHKGEEYVITDRDTVREARSIFGALPDIEMAEHAIDIETDELERQMERFEESMEEIEERIEAGSLVAIRELEAAVRKLETVEIEAITERIEAQAEHLEEWAEELEERIEDEAIPLFEDAIRTGKAKRIR